MTDSRFTEIAHNPDILNKGWNQPFRTVGAEVILNGVQLNFRFGDIAVTMTTEAEPENIRPMRKGGTLETSRVNLIIDTMPVKGKDYTVHIQTPDKVTHKGVSKRSKDGNVQSFSGWQEALGKTDSGHVKYSKDVRPLAITALDLQNSQIAIGRSASTNRDPAA